MRVKKTFFWPMLLLIFSTCLLKADSQDIETVLNTQLIDGDISSLTRSILTTSVINKSGLVIVPRTWPYLIEIKSSNVVLELAGNQLRGGILIDENVQNITIQNGIIDSSPTTTAVGIHAKTGAQHIKLQNLKIRSAQQGILFEGVHDSTIKLCDISGTGTAVNLTDSYNIAINNTYSYASGQIGFSLLRSFTCVLEECNALSTGDGNTNITENNVFGFVAENGGGNIFERCIANSTQALSTTDSQSLVAGFALRGSEGCSKIIECESANTQTDVSGVTIPYGILIEAQFDELVSVTSVNLSSPGIRSVSWSPDGQYLAAGGDHQYTIDSEVFIYRFNRLDGHLTQVDTINIRPGFPNDYSDRVAWSPDGGYIVIGVGTASPGDYYNDVIVYSFDYFTEKLTEVTGVNLDSGVNNEGVTALNWSPDGRYLAVGTAYVGAGDSDLFVYKFDSVAQTLTLIAQADIDQAALGDDVRAIEWSPDGIYLAVGASDNDAVFNLFIYKFDRGLSTLVRVFEANFGDLSYGRVAEISWSPDGQYVAVGGKPSYDDRSDLGIYRFDRSSQSLIPVDDVDFDGYYYNDAVYGVDWSPDGQYLAIGADPYIAAENDLFIYRFDRGIEKLALLDQVNLGTNYEDAVRSVQWSPDGQYLAVGVDPAVASADSIFIFSVLTFPSKNVIKDNTVYCNSGGSLPYGFGISGSSIANLIIGNTAYGNPLMPFMVGQNYAFVCNVFNPLFGIGPQLTQNISVDADTPICTPPDFDLLLEQTKFKACSFVDAFADTISILDLIATGPSCNPTTLMASPIANEGYYCLANPISSGGLAINASNVALDLNGYHVVGGISFANRDQVTIFNGTVENSGSNAIAATNSSNVTLSTIKTKDSQIGVNFNAVTGSLIKNCSFTQNTTGIQLTSSNNVIIDSCVASCNTNAGFDLISSTTNIIKNSKALSTGENNTQTTNQIIVGFIATDGNANIFEQCVANGAQGLQVTDTDSLIAGFVLRGSESCSKIIASEAANSVTNASGSTTPYGIIVQGSSEKNTIIQNMVYCNSNDTNGIGISGNNVANLIIQNTTYCNPINLRIGSNVDELVSLIDNPTALTNIAIPCSYAIPLPADLNLTLDQINSLVDVLAQCESTPITQGTTIAQAGNYCLSLDITGDISITTTCVVLNLNEKCVTGIISVATAEDVVIQNGTVKPPAPTSAPSAAISIASSALRVQIFNTVIFCNDTSEAGIAGRDGISIAGHNVTVGNCSITSGSGGDNTGASAAGNAGHGIIIANDSEQTIIKNCILQTGNGGDTGSGTAGDGGNGILVQDGASSAEIINCTVMSTGVGGNSSGTNGDGGHGIYIEDGAVDVAVNNSTVRNTGLGGSGAATLGLPGKAVFDLVTISANLSQIFKNFAHNIANPTKFDIQAPTIAGGPEDGILSPNPPDGTVLNPFANIYT